jgi:hypothetical protein
MKFITWVWIAYLISFMCLLNNYTKCDETKWFLLSLAYAGSSSFVIQNAL